MKLTHSLLALLISGLGTSLVAVAALTPPRPLETPAPAYPHELEDSGQSGQATIELTITPEGGVTEARVQAADHPAFGRAALAVLEQWRFEPARRDGEPVSQRVVLPFNFRAPLDQQFNAMVGRKVFQQLPSDTEIIDEAQLPRKLRPANPTPPPKPGVMVPLDQLGQLNPPRHVPPVLPRSLQGREFDDVITVSCIVTPEGLVINPELEEMPQTAELAGPALLTAALSRFHPPRLGNRPVHVRTTLAINFATPKREDNLWWQYENNVPSSLPGPGGSIGR
jgi:TonB family protein